MSTIPCVMLHFAELTQHEAGAVGISRPASPSGTSDVRGVIDIPEASHGTEMNVERARHTPLSSGQIDNRTKRVAPMKNAAALQVGAGMETRHNLRPTTTVCGPLGTGCAVTSP